MGSVRGTALSTQSWWGQGYSVAKSAISDWNTVKIYLIEMSPPVRFLLDYIFQKSYMEKNTDYGHTKAKSLILCGPKQIIEDMDIVPK